jgi:hypothetical protein
VQTVYFLQGKAVRAIKKKNPQFDEVNPRQVWECTESGTRSSKKRTKERANMMEEELARYLNLNRLHSLESKLGPVTLENATVAAQELAEDALKDFIADSPAMWAKLDKRGQDIRRKHFQSRVAAWLTEQLEGSAEGAG